jgi:hypothetical protein
LPGGGFFPHRHPSCLSDPVHAILDPSLGTPAAIKAFPHLFFQARLIFPQVEDIPVKFPVHALQERGGLLPIFFKV